MNPIPIGTNVRRLTSCPGISRNIKRFSQGLLSSSVAMMLALALVGCGHKHDDDHGHDHDHEHDHDHGHSEASPSGASFQSDKGVLLTEETRQNLGVEVAEATQRSMPHHLRLTVQVFGEKHQHLINSEDHTGCDVHGSGLVAVDAAAAVRVGQTVEVLKDTNAPLGGIVLAVQKALALGESEVVIGVSNATSALKAGEFVPARIHLPSESAVVAIPQTALLRTAEGTFVYVVNGDAYLRTTVKAGSEADGWVEITDGLSPGARVVTKPVQTLWLIELRATKGGGHAH